METLVNSIAAASLKTVKGCTCLQAWQEFKASRAYPKYISAEMQQGVFNDVPQVGTSAKKKRKKLQAKSPPGWKHTVEHMKKHKEITNPYALANWMKDQGDVSHVHSK